MEQQGYDGDGNRVQGSVGGVVTAYLGNYFEWTGSTSTMVKYYYAGGARIAMRKGATERYWLLTDHLGGTNVTVTTGGDEYGELRYEAWGETYFTSGTTPTTMRYTGQREEQSLGIYFYNARYYDPMLGRFIQADSIIPNPSDPPSFDRYAYVRNSPVIFNDPSGHDLNCGVRGSHAAPEDCAEADPGYTGNVFPTNPDTLDWNQLSDIGKQHYVTYRDMWSDRSDTAWWWNDLRLGGDGHFSVNDYMAMVLNAELDGMYNKSAYVAEWQESLARLSYTNNISRTPEGMLNFVAGQVGGIRMYPENYYDSSLEGLDTAIETLNTIWNPLVMGHGEWMTGCIPGRPCYAGSYTSSSNRQLYYIDAFIDAGCPLSHVYSFYGSCAGDFSFFLDQGNANYWHDEYCAINPTDWRC